MFKPWQKLNRPASHLELGQLGEKLAAEFLLQAGYRLVATNFTAPIGYSLSGRPVTGEIDLVAYDETRLPFVLSFIEVKTRRSRAFAAPQAAVDRRKQRQIVKTARLYRRMLRVADEPYRYDVVSVLLLAGAAPQLELLRGYFGETSFAHSHWRQREY